MVYNPTALKNALATAWLMYPFLLFSAWLFGPLLLELAAKLGQPFGYWESLPLGILLLIALHLTAFAGIRANVPWLGWSILPLGIYTASTVVVQPHHGIFSFISLLCLSSYLLSGALLTWLTFLKV